MTTPLNQNAVRRAADAVSELYADGYCPKAEDSAEVAVSAYLAVAQPVEQKLTDAEWQAFQAIPDQGYSHRAWVDARIAERVAVAQPVVTSVEELDALPAGSLVRSGGREFYKTSYIDLPWVLPYGVDRFGSGYLAKHSKVTMIHRTAVNDA